MTRFVLNSRIIFGAAIIMFSFGYQAQAQNNAYVPTYTDNAHSSVNTGRVDASLNEARVKNDQNILMRSEINADSYSHHSSRDDIRRVGNIESRTDTGVRSTATQTIDLR